MLLTVSADAIDFVSERLAALAWIGIADCQYHARDFQSALDSCGNATRLFRGMGESTSSLVFASLELAKGSVEEARGRLADALLHFERAAAIFSKVLPPTHPRFGEMMGQFSRLHRTLGNPIEADRAEKVSISIARRSQVACVGPGCVRRLREDGAPLDVCIKCRCTFYCGKTCQTADWKREGGHKSECKALIAEGEAAGEGADAPELAGRS